MTVSSKPIKVGPTVVPVDRVKDFTVMQGSRASVTAADFDGDGAPDLVGMGTARPLLFRNSGAGDFVRVTNSLLSTFQSAQGLSPVWGDFDNDGDLDVVMSYVGSASKDVQLFLNDGSGGFTFPVGGIPGGLSGGSGLPVGGPPAGVGGPS